jgi:hypothetical protein
MQKILLTVTAACAIIFFTACKKSENVSDARTVQNLSGSFHLNAIIWTTAGININVYDSLPPCEKDNVIQLNSDLTLDFIDGDIVCDPNETDHGTWSLSSNGDSLYFNSNPAYINSWDGKILVLSEIVEQGPPVVTGKTTLEKR